jgi:hypothetical protein
MYHAHTGRSAETLREESKTHRVLKKNQRIGMKNLTNSTASLYGLVEASQR